MLSNRDIRGKLEIPHLNKKDDYGNLKWLNNVKSKLTGTKVGEIMTKPVQTVLKTNSVVEAAKLLRVGAVSSLVVVDSDESNRCIGIITRSDILDQFIRTFEPN